MGALITLAIVCTLLLLAKSRYSITQAGGISGEASISNRCPDCSNESKLNCRMLYNRLFGFKKGTCTKCIGSPQIGGLKFCNQMQFNSYGKVKVGSLESSQIILGGSFLSEPSEFSLSCEPTTTTLEMSQAGNDEQEHRSEEAGGLCSAAGQTNNISTTTASSGLCTGLGFDPDAISAATLTSGSSTDEQQPEQLEVAQLDAGHLNLTSNHLALARKDGPSYVAFEVSSPLPINDHKEHNIGPQNELSQHHQGSSYLDNKPKMVNNGSVKFRWMKTMRKVWRTQHIAMLFRQASKQVNTLKQTASMTSRAGCDGSQSAQQTVSKRIELEQGEQPELLSSKKLRSADIQM